MDIDKFLNNCFSYADKRLEIYDKPLTKRQKEQLKFVLKDRILHLLEKQKG